MTEYSQNKNKNLLVSEVIERMDPPYRDVYKDSSEIQNYAQDGSFFYKASKPEILMKIVEHALSKGLDPSEKLEFLKGSAIWEDLNKTQQKDMLAAFMSDCYFPGPIHITKTLTEKFHLKTIAEIDSDREKIYFFNGQIYERAEEKIKAESHMEYLKQWEKMLTSAEANEDKSLTATLREKLNRGPSVNDINEVMAMIRRTTFTQDEMNPSSHVPFLNGLMNLETGKMEGFSHDLFYTYQVDANLIIDRYISLRDTPLFAGLLNTLYYEPDVPLVLSYLAYCLYPGFPIHKTLFVLGRPRIGKGTSTRVIQKLMPKGAGAISLERLLTGERFQFSGVEGKNLLVDSEVKRKFRRGIDLSWTHFTNLFGGDIITNELKGRETHDYINTAKGIFLANLPFILVDDPAAINRMLVVVTRNERPSHVIPDLDKMILESERDQIATLLTEVLFKLIDREFIFPGEMSDDATADLLEQLADPVQNFIDEETEYVEENQVLTEDVYSRFTEWCKQRGIPALTKQTFTKRFSYTYPKKKLGPRKKRNYYFINCMLTGIDEDVTVQDRLQVGHGYNSQETLEISLSGERYRRVQHVYSTPHVTRKKNNDHDVKEYVQKLDTGVFASGSLENKALPNIKSVSNLQAENEHSHDGSEKKVDEESSDLKIQSERKRWALNPKLELFNLVEEYAPKSKYHSLKPKAIHDMIAMYGIDLSTVHDLCEELTREYAFQKTDAGGYYINKAFLEGGDYH
jgi:putative DNA primase/helicase